MKCGISSVCHGIKLIFFATWLKFCLGFWWSLCNKFHFSYAHRVLLLQCRRGNEWKRKAFGLIVAKLANMFISHKLGLFTKFESNLCVQRSIEFFMLKCGNADIFRNGSLDFNSSKFILLHKWYFFNNLWGENRVDKILRSAQVNHSKN